MWFDTFWGNNQGEKPSEIDPPLFATSTDPSAIDSESIEPLSVLYSKLRFEW